MFHEATGLRSRRHSFHGRFLLSGNILMQNCAIPRNALQNGFVRLADEKHAAQRRENLRKNSGLNYKSATLNQLSYAGVPIRKPFLASSSRVGPKCRIAMVTTPLLFRGGAGIEKAQLSETLGVQMFRNLPSYE